MVQFSVVWLVCPVHLALGPRPGQSVDPVYSPRGVSRAHFGVLKCLMPYSEPECGSHDPSVGWHLGNVECDPSSHVEWRFVVRYNLEVIRATIVGFWNRLPGIAVHGRVE